MTAVWSENIRASLELVKNNAGPELVTVVSGSETDRKYWHEQFAQTRRDVFRSDGATAIHAVAETQRKGNFLGTLNAWRQTRPACAPRMCR